MARSKAVIIASIIRICECHLSVRKASPLLFITVSMNDTSRQEKYELHVHGNTAFADNDGFLSQVLVSFLRYVAYLKRVVVPHALLAPIERSKWEHTLRQIQLPHQLPDIRRLTRDRPWTLTEKSPKPLLNNAFRSYLHCMSIVKGSSQEALLTNVERKPCSSADVLE